VDNNYDSVFNNYLSKSEYIIWFGKPETTIYFTHSDFILIPFSLLFGIPAILWEIQTFNMIQKNGLADFYYGIPFLIMGLYLLFGRFIFKKWKKKRTYYAITNKRIIIMTNIWGTHFNNMVISSILKISKKINSIGVGTLVFKEHSSILGLLFRFHISVNNTGLDILPFYSSEIGFYDIQNAEKVYNLIKEQLNVQLK
jgi:hypothetical protein